ncbi:DUF6077 domain-containing protein [Aeromicrobium wangtongii]|uniref:DUF6077 domain-containing protein n=1 Tax=Aeromicrobium wangtongii TaxID=2969247 RepID=UPI0020175BE4|nr:DUF6077 domain-containing protein [Aeromicrobium wangtongii]MCL3816999.1 DUF6077 domain-containing protein [Aeromicrobium wangtongii]
MRTRTPALTGPRWPRFLDGASDGLLLAFAAWTVFYELALVLQFSMVWAGWPWIALAVCLAVGSGLHAMRREGTDLVGPRPDRPRSSARRLDLRVLAVGLVILAVLVARREQWEVWPIAVVAIVLLVGQLLPRRVGRAPQPPPGAAGPQVPEVGHGAHLFALALSIGFGVLGLFLLRPDADDAFYVNRATWVAEHGTATTNDTMFGPGTLQPASDAGLLTPSVESLQGVIAHALGIQAATVCYLLAVPVLGALCAWTTWRLARAWAPRRPELVMAVAMLFLLASADSIVGNYSLGRIWQGKATAYAILIPLVWLFLSRTVDRARRADLVMLAAAGVAFVGLTTTSALLAPVIAGSALLAAVILRSRSLASGALVFLAAPLVNGLAQAFGSAAIGNGDSTIVEARDAVTLTLGTNAAMILLGLAALVLVPRTAAGATGVLLGCGALATMVALLPGVFELADAVTGAGPIAWRLLIAMPMWVMVGLLVTMPFSRVRSERLEATRVPVVAGARAALLAVVVVVPLVFGSWLWQGTGASLTSRPTWKVNQDALADVRAAQALDVPPGRWLMPPEQMQILAISTSGPYPVVARGFYLPGLDVSDRDLADRIALFRLAAGEPVSVREVRGALDRLDVALACVPDAETRRILRRAVGAQPKRVGDMYCHVA